MLSTLCCVSLETRGAPDLSQLGRPPQGVIAVEGLNLEALRPGLHMLHCLPLKLAGSDGAPVRCITIA